MASHKFSLTLIRSISGKGGFTLLELLIASVMTFFVVSATGWALVVMLRENIAISGSSDIQTNLNRALDFMADEAKSASSIYTNLSSAISDASGGSFPTSTKTLVLALDAGLTYPIIYYFRDPGSSSVWLGPNVLYRWGPGLDPSGQYNGSWSEQELTDMVASASEAGASCGLGSLPSGTGLSGGDSAATTASPVFVCVDSTGKSAEIHAYASLEDEFSARGLGTSTDSRLGDKGKYDATTRVYARSTSDVEVGTSATFSVPTGNPTQASLSASGCTLPLSITYQGASGSTTASMNTTSNFELLLYNASPSMSISGLTYTQPTAATSTVEFTGSGCTVTAKLTTP